MTTKQNRRDRPVIYSYSAIDRFNFGDLLFPRILEWHMPQVIRQSYALCHTAPTSADLMHRGGYKVHSLFSSLRSASARESVVIIPGGEVLSVSAVDILKMLPQLKWRVLLKLSSRFLHTSFLLRFAAYFMGIPCPVAFVPARASMTGVRHIAFQSVGGINLRTFRYKKTVFDNLREASHISVRDKVTYETVVPEVPRTRLFPDIVSLIARCNPKSALVSQSFLAKQLVSSHRKYFVFQLALRHIKQADIASICSLLREFALKFGFFPVLLPMSNAPAHNDDVAMRLLSTQMGIEHVAIESPTVDDIVSLLAHAQCVIGTSLHANIVAAAYATPIAPLSFLEEKTRLYFETWWPEAVARMQGWDDIIPLSLASIESSFVDRKNRSDELSARADQSLNLLWENLFPNEMGRR